jgi:hypothetical protein
MRWQASGSEDQRWPEKAPAVGARRCARRESTAARPLGGSRWRGQRRFKFSFGRNDRCAGTALIPEAVWDSWQPFLAQPELRPQPDGTFALTKPDEPLPHGKVPSWIYIIDIDGESKVTPNPIAVRKIIASTADALNHYALVEAPNFASEAQFAADGIYATLRRRINTFWPAESLQLQA